MTSAYPIAMDELIGRVRSRAVQLRAWPSRNQVMTEFRVGGPKARDALAALRASGFDPTRPGSATEEPATVRADTGRPGTAEQIETYATSTEPAAADTTGVDTTGADTAGVDRAGDAAALPSAAPALRAVPDPAADDDADRAGGEDGRVGTGGGRGEHKGAEPTETGTGRREHVGHTPPVDAAPPAGPATRLRLVTGSVDPGTTTATTTATATASPDAPTAPVLSTGGRVRVPRWPLVLIALGAFVSIWGGWVGLGELTGFGEVRLLPGIADGFVIDSAITLPIGVEAYAAFALRAWLNPPTSGLSRVARQFACWSALGALALGAAGQIAYHLMVAAGMTQAPWQITAFVSCLPVVVLGCGAALTHLIHQPAQEVTR